MIGTVGAARVPWVELARPEALLLLLLMIPILVLYLVAPLRHRSRDPFFFLWKTLVPRRPWLGRLNRLVEVLVILTALFLLVLALGNPGRRENASPPRFLILALAGNPTPSSLEKARGLLGELDPRETGCVVAGGPGGSRIVVPPSRGPFVLAHLPRTLAGPGEVDSPALVWMVQALAHGRKGVDVHWFGDPRDLESLPGKKLPDPWTLHPLSGNGAVRADVSLAVHRTEAGGLGVEVRNAGSGSWRGTLNLKAGGEERKVTDLDLRQGGRRSLHVPLLPERSGKVVLALEGEGAAWEAGHYVPRLRPSRIGVLARGGDALPLRRFLAALGDRIDQAGSGVLDQKEAAACLERIQGETPPFDFLVCQDPVAQPLEVPIPVLYFGCAGSLGKPVGDPAGPGGISVWNRDHPLLAGVDLSPVSAEAVVRVQPARGVQVLAEGPAGPMMLASAGPPARVAFPFLLEKSNFYLTWGFTRLLSNIIRIWGGEQKQWGPCHVEDRFPLPTGMGQVAVSREGDPSPIWTGEIDVGFPFRARRPGLFEASGGWGRRSCYFNPVWPGLRPAVPTSHMLDARSGPEAEEGQGPGTFRTFCLALAWAAMGVLLLEWFLFHRVFR